MKTQVMWSGTALCGLLGLWVWHCGGWPEVESSIKPIKLVKMVWVTNEVFVPKRDAWSEPLKPIDQSPEMFIPWEGHRIPNPQYFTQYPSVSNILFDHNVLLTNFTNTFVATNIFMANAWTNAIMYTTNFYFVNPGITNYFR